MASQKLVSNRRGGLEADGRGQEPRGGFRISQNISLSLSVSLESCGFEDVFFSCRLVKNLHGSSEVQILTLCYFASSFALRGDLRKPIGSGTKFGQDRGWGVLWW